MSAFASRRLAVGLVALGFLFSTRAGAFIRMPMWDDELIDQSDLIVIAHLKENRFEIAKDAQDPEFDRKVYFTTLVIDRVLKGAVSLGDLRIGLHYPNYPTVLGSGDRFEIVPQPAGEHPDPAAKIGVAAIVGTIMVTKTDDIRHGHIWFLRSHAPPHYRVSDVAGPPGLWFPEGVQTEDLVPYYQAIMTGDGKAVAAYDDGKVEWWSRRVQFASERLAVKQAVRESDLGKRCDELLKIYTADGPFSPAGTLALKEIANCGDVGATKLIPLFMQGDAHAFDRRGILQAWQGMGCNKESQPVILSWLREEEDWWNKTYGVADRRFAAVDGQKGGAPYDDPRAVSFRNIFCSIEFLDGTNRAEALSVIEEIRKDWGPAGPFSFNNDLPKTCDDVLTHLK